MTLGFVLVHGGCHRASCWNDVLPHLAAPAVAADLPGRGDAKAVGRVGLDGFAAVVVDAIDSAPFERVVLVGHSLAGAVIPEAARRRPDQTDRLVFVSATIPPEGGSAADTVLPFLRPVARWQGRTGRAITPVPAVARRLFCNDLDPARTRRLLDQLSPESARLGIEKVSRLGLPAEIPSTYVLLLRDRAMPPRRQHRQIANLGRPCDVVTLDSGHDPFFSRPAELAAILNATIEGRA